MVKGGHTPELGAVRDGVGGGVQARGCDRGCGTGCGASGTSVGSYFAAWPGAGLGERSAACRC